MRLNQIGALLVALLVAVSVAAIPVQAAGTTDVSLSPDESTLSEGETTSFDVVVENVSGGVGAYNFTVEVGNQSVAEITDVAVEVGGVKDINWEDNRSVTVDSALGNTADSGSVTLASVTVQGNEIGNSPVNLTVDALTDELAIEYAVSNTSDATITVQEPTSFDVSYSVDNTTVLTGETVPVTATVENTGDVSGSTTVNFYADGEEFANESVSVDGGNSTTVSAATSFTEAGTHNVTVNDLNATEITIESSGPEGPSNIVRLTPPNQSVSPETTSTFDLEFTNVTNGVGVYNITIATGNQTVADISDVNLHVAGAPSTTDIQWVENKSVTLTTALADSADEGNVTLANVTIQGKSVGNTTIGVTAENIGDEDGNAYTIDEIQESMFIVNESQLQPVVGEDPPTDIDGDGLYEDVNGDGSANILDIQVFYSNLGSDPVQNNPDAFDYNSDGSVNILDVQALFTNL